MIGCLCGTGYCFYKKRKDEKTAWEFNIPRSRSSSRIRLNDPALYSQEGSPLESPNRVMSPVSDTSSLGSNNRVKRSYDKSYKTNEPLPDKPDVEWEEKEWDLSPEGSEFDAKKLETQNINTGVWDSSPKESDSSPTIVKPRNTISSDQWDSSPESSMINPMKYPVVPLQNKKTARANSDPEYETILHDPNMSRTNTLDSGIGYDKHDRPLTVYTPPEYGKINENLKNPNSASQPILNYTDDDYAKPLKNQKKETEKPLMSMSSKVTDV